MNGSGLLPIDAWSLTLQQLEFHFDRALYDTWVRGALLLRVESADGDVFVIGVKNSYARDMLQHRLYRNIHRVLSDVYGRPVDLRFEVNKSAETANTALEDMPLFKLLKGQETASTPDDSAAFGGTSEPRPALHQQLARPRRAELPESVLNPRFTFNRFITGSENALVFAAVQSIFERPDAAYNPLFIYGIPGTGKTHLLQAVAHECRHRDLRSLYIPSEAFTNDLVDAIRQKSTAMFREKYRSVDVLLVDDIQFIGGKESTQEEFFHTFNTLHAFNKQIVLASDRHPRELNTLEERLRSRFEGGLIVDLQPPGLETRLAILRLWASERSLMVPREVLMLLAERARLNIRELEGVFNQIVAASLYSGETITVDLVQELLDGFRRPRTSLTVQRVLETVARHFQMTAVDLIGPRRTERINHARQIAMYLSRSLTQASLPQIGDAFGGRKHSTVLHACNAIGDLLEIDSELRSTVENLRGQLVGRD